ncbi:GyrI-like domain-containing protein [Caldalkalibacillus horti]|uniref:GyrI-like small molecule binding domain-containing protein n=1 Tax=Caldalkalibacillus horti TaxID=77523 RepID=A0ABT9VWE8_9BACI|nr:GyrI-like domain-containing protein [Bacillus horti]MDQ0165316.1 hypothetical protein [Bacillus horti]
MSLFQQKLDLSRTDKNYYSATGTPQLIQLNEIPYLTITGYGAPESDMFINAVEALYTVAYAIKNISKKDAKDFVVPKLEGLWWVNSENEMLEVPRGDWHWKLMIRMPDFVSERIADDACKVAIAKKKKLDLIHNITFEIINEGACVQMMHIGPYSTEPDTIEHIHTFMHSHDFVQNGLHHEIYISDPRKVKPSLLKTILRYPVKKQK